MFDEARRAREVVCHASAWDVQYNNDLRIKMCIEPNEEDLITIHHELGHDYYFHDYYKLPMLFQAGANDGFHEAIGDTIALSMTPEYLKKIGLLDKVVQERQGDDQPQMKVALEKVAFLPFGLHDRQVALGRVLRQARRTEYNAALVGAAARSTRASRRRSPRTEADFDPGAKYHVAGEHAVHALLPRAHLQFQFHRALCKAAGFTGPLARVLDLRQQGGRREAQGDARARARASRGRRRCRAHRRDADGRERDPRVLRAAAEVARGAEQGPAVRLVK